MGSEPPKRQQPRVSLQDAVIEMKMQSKLVARQAKKSEKEQQKYKKKAKQALKKNNQEGAKMYLMSAANKRTQALNYQRTAVKMDIMCDKVKSMKNNQALVNTFGNMTHVINQQMNQVDSVKMMESMNMLNAKMDQVMINNKMMGQIMQSNDAVQNQTVDDMMNVLKQELTLQQANQMQIPSQQQYNYNQQQQQTNSNQAQQQGINSGGNSGGNQANDPFLDQLKDL